MGNFTNIILDTQFVKGENVIEIISKKPLKEDGTLLYKDPGSNGTQSSPSLDSIEIYSYKECKQLKGEEVPSTCLENGYKKITNEYGLEIIKDIKITNITLNKLNNAFNIMTLLLIISIKALKIVSILGKTKLSLV